MVYSSRISALSCLSCGSKQLEGGLITCFAETGIVLAVLSAFVSVSVCLSLFACPRKTEKLSEIDITVVMCCGALRDF